MQNGRAGSAGTHAASDRNRTASSPGLLTTVSGCRRKARPTTITAIASARAASRRSFLRMLDELSTNRGAIYFQHDLRLVHFEWVDPHARDAPARLAESPWTGEREAAGDVVFGALSLTRVGEEGGVPCNKGCTGWTTTPWHSQCS